MLARTQLRSRKIVTISQKEEFDNCTCLGWVLILKGAGIQPKQFKFDFLN